VRPSLIKRNNALRTDVCCAPKSEAKAACLLKDMFEGRLIRAKPPLRPKYITLGQTLHSSERRLNQQIPFSTNG
jgi:hypothetical protein